MELRGLQKLTLLDYPEHTACTVFTGGCNLRCPFCHNASLVLRAADLPSLTEGDLFSFLDKRRGLLDGVCISGGEPTLQHDLPDFMLKLKNLGFSVKLDTNGMRPQVLRQLLDDGLCDYVAMDIKSSPERYAAVSGIPDLNVEPVLQSAALLMETRVPFEFRTTVVDELHQISDFDAIGQWLTGAPRFFIQCFRDSGDLIGDGFSPPSSEKLRAILNVLQHYIPSATLRGSE